MSTYKIDLNRMSNMMAEQKNLSDIVAGTAENIASLIESLYEGCWYGEDAELYDMYTLQTVDEILDVPVRKIEGERACFERAYNSFTDAKTYCEEFGELFGVASGSWNSNVSSDSILFCDVDCISEIKNLCIKIELEKMGMIGSIFSTRVIVDTLESARSELNMLLDDLEHNVKKLGMIEEHREHWGKYVSDVIKADDQFKMELLELMPDEILEKNSVLLNVKPEVALYSWLMLKEDLNADENELIEMLEQNGIVDPSFSDKVISYLLSVEDRTSYNEHYINFLCREYSEGVENNNIDLLSDVFNCMAVYDETGNCTRFDIKILTSVQNKFDPNEEGLCYYSLAKFSHYSGIGKLQFVVTNDNGELCLSTDGDGEDAYIGAFVDMNEVVTEKGIENLTMLGMTQSEIVKFMSNVANDTDVEFVGYLTNAQIGGGIDNTEYCSIFDAIDPAALSEYVDISMGMYMHGAFASAENIPEGTAENFINAMLGNRSYSDILWANQTYPDSPYLYEKGIQYIQHLNNGLTVGYKSWASATVREYEFGNDPELRALTYERYIEYRKSAGIVASVDDIMTRMANYDMGGVVDANITNLKFDMAGDVSGSYFILEHNMNGELAKEGVTVDLYNNELKNLEAALKHIETERFKYEHRWLLLVGNGIKDAGEALLTANGGGALVYALDQVENVCDDGSLKASAMTFDEMGDIELGSIEFNASRSFDNAVTAAECVSDFINNDGSSIKEAQLAFQIENVGETVAYSVGSIGSCESTINDWLDGSNSYVSTPVLESVISPERYVCSDIIKEQGLIAAAGLDGDAIDGNLGEKADMGDPENKDCDSKYEEVYEYQDDIYKLFHGGYDLRADLIDNPDHASAVIHAACIVMNEDSEYAPFHSALDDVTKQAVMELTNTEEN